MQKLFLLVLMGLLFFIGGQWLGLQIQGHNRQVGDASAPITEPTSSPLPMDPLKPTPLAPVK